MKNNTKIAIFPGSFDPITLGHLEIIKEGSKMFDRVVVAVATNPDKKNKYTAEKRLEMINQCIKNLSNVESACFEGLTAEYAKNIGADIILRGLRSARDFEYEEELAQNNKLLAPDITTVFLTTKPEYNFISSSAVREILNHSGDISKFVPPEIHHILR